MYNYAARIVKGQSKKVCKHYLIDSNNNKIDISCITSERCFSMVKEALNSIKLRRISKKDISTLFNQINNFLKIYREYNGSVQFSLDNLRDYIELSYDEKTSPYVKDLFASDASLMLYKVDSIAQYKKESKEDFSNLTKQERLSVVNELEKNSLRKKQYFESKQGMNM